MKPQGKEKETKIDLKKIAKHCQIDSIPGAKKIYK